MTKERIVSFGFWVNTARGPRGEPAEPVGTALGSGNTDEMSVELWL